MPRIESLIKKLMEQYQNKVNPSLMLATTQLIEAEIMTRLKETEVLGASNISVLIPNIPTALRMSVANDPSAGQKEFFELSGVADETDEDIEPGEANYEIHINKNLVFEAKELPSEKAGADAFDIEDIPTFYHQKNKEKEMPLFERIKQDDKAEKIRDLKKAIGLTEREVLIKELFRGDEDMYERSIKTVNNFVTHAEAEYWIKRELKTKIGWPIDSEAVQFFDDLIKRRFS